MRTICLAVKMALRYMINDDRNENCCLMYASMVNTHRIRCCLSIITRCDDSQNYLIPPDLWPCNTIYQSLVCSLGRNGNLSLLFTRSSSFIHTEIKLQTEEKFLKWRKIYSLPNDIWNQLWTKSNVTWHHFF